MDRPWLTFDTWGLLALNAGPNQHGLINFARFISGEAAVGMCLLLLLALVRRDSRTLALRALACMGVAWCLVHGIQQLVPLPRPAALGLGHQWIGQGPRPGFPSMHAAVAFALAIYLALQRFRGAWVAVAFALLMAWSRVCLGVHFPLDVLAGAATGGLAALAVAGASAAFALPRPWLGRRPLA